MAYSAAEVAQETQSIKLAQQGDSEAFGPLVSKYQRRVLSLVYHLVRRRDEVEDLAQEIFIKAFRAIRSYNFESSFGTWLSRIATNHCYDYLRHERASRVTYYWQMAEERQHELESRVQSLPASELDHEDRAVLGDLVGKLLDRAPEKDRQILILKEIEDLSVEQIADTLRLKPTTVKVRLHRARKRMLEDLRNWRKGE